MKKIMLNSINKYSYFYLFHLILGLVIYFVMIMSYFDLRSFSLPYGYKIFSHLATHNGSWFVIVYFYVFISFINNFLLQGNVHQAIGNDSANDARDKLVEGQILASDKLVEGQLASDKLSKDPAKSQYDVNVLIFNRLNCLVILILDVSLFLVNPFKIDPRFTLNPLLQDYGLFIHPPILYLSYVLSFWCCYYTIITMILTENCQIHLKKILNITRLAWTLALFGIALGSHWAYRELGWGGYWFYDPIENLSLMVFISLSAFYHFLIINIKTKRLARLTFIFANLVCFGIVLNLALSRSGLLVSVHTFMLNSFPAMIIYIGIGLFLTWMVIATTKVKEINTTQSYKTRGMIFGGLFSIYGYFILLIAIMAPIISKTIYQIETSVNEEFFHDFLNPQVLLIMILMSLFVKEKKLYILTACTLCLSFLLLKLIGLLDIYLLLALVLILNSAYLMQDKISGMLISHLGFGLLIFSIVINKTYEDNFSFQLSVGETVNIETNLGQSIEVSLEEINYLQESNFYSARAKLTLQRSSYNDDSKFINSIGIDSSNSSYGSIDFKNYQFSKLIQIDLNRPIMLYPELRLYTSTVNIEPCIKSYLFYDLYAVYEKVIEPEAGNDFVEISPEAPKPMPKNKMHAITVSYKPMMSWIWFSVLLMLLGSVLNFCRRK